MIGMARIARVVVPKVPHHVVQWGNRRQQTFWEEQDYRYYLDLLKENCLRSEVSVWAYCLMPNHIHLILVPETVDGLTKAVGQTHHRYTKAVNLRQGWTGYLWQGRYCSYPMDSNYLFICAQYIEMNPVRAGLVQKPEEWQWSSAGYHLDEREDDIISEISPLDTIADWKAFLHEEDQTEYETLCRHERTGRPLGTTKFIEKCSAILNRDLAKRKPGPKGPRKKRRIKRAAK